MSVVLETQEQKLLQLRRQVHDLVQEIISFEPRRVFTLRQYSKDKIDQMGWVTINIIFLKLERQVLFLRRKARRERKS